MSRLERRTDWGDVHGPRDAFFEWGPQQTQGTLAFGNSVAA